MNLDKALDKAKVGVMLHGSIFLSTIVASMSHVWNDKIPTARTNGKVVEYSPDFFEGLNSDQRVALIAHEAWHVALMHMTRQGTRCPDYYNKAGDYVINQMLHDNGFDLPPNGCQEDRFRDMSTNQVYDIIFKENDSPNSSNQDIIYSIENGDEEDQQGTPQDIEALENFLKGVIVKAKTQSEMMGDKPGAIPGEIERRIQTLINPLLPWEDILNRFLTDKVKNDYTWARPNKRFMPDFYMPTQHSDSLSKITVAIDTSGSIRESDLQAILSEIQYIRDTMKPKEMVIIDCDYSIHGVYDITEEEHILDLKFTGGGGTSCTPVMEYCRKNPTTALIYFTDLYMTKWTEQMDFPILWIVYNNPSATAPVGEITYYKMRD